MLRTLFTSSSGLRGHQELLDVIGNNLANVNTTGFKAQRLRFGTQFSETLQAATAPGTTGGTNPRQVGNGSLTTAIDGDFNTGNLEDTGNSLDMAIEGEGFFVLNDGRQNLYTRAGAFSVDAEGLLVDAGTGMRVQRFGVVGEANPSDPTQPVFQTSGDNDIHIDFDRTSVPGKASTQSTFRGNLNSQAIGPLNEQVRINSALTVGGVAATGASFLDLLDQTTSPYALGDQIHITGTTADGKDVSAVFVAAGGGADTLQDLIDTINAGFGSTSPNGATASIDTNGFIVLTADRAGPARLTINLASVETLGAPIATGLTTFNNFVSVVEGKEGDTTTTAIEVFDDQGTGHTLTFTFQKQTNNEWDMIASIDGSADFIDANGRALDNRIDGIRFNEDGSFQSVTGQDTYHVIATSLPLTVTPAAAPFASTVAVTAATAAATNLDTLDQVTAGNTAAVGETAIVVATGVKHDGTTFNVTSGALTTVADLLTFLNTAAVFDSANPDGATASIVNGNLVVTANSPGPSRMSLLSLATQSVAASPIAINFDSFATTTTGQDGDDNITFEVTNLQGFATTQTVQLNLGTVNQFDGLTQFGGFTSAAAVEQDGFAPGDLVDVAVSGEGIINGIFSNGGTHALAQLAVANFANDQGLFRVGSNLFREDLNSGQAIVGAAGANGTGSVQGSVLEASNVDVTLEFTRLITAQRGFQVNARAFTTADQVLQETVNLKQ